MHWTFAASLEFTISFLESSFKQDPRFAATNTTDDTKPEFFSSNNHGDNPNTKQQKLDHAYKFMELTPPVTQEDLKKKYKKLSLRYHPDRNGGSQESQQQMQVLNACMEMIEKDLAGVDDSNDAKNEDHHHHEDSENDEDEDPMEKYKRMRKEREEAMAAEMKRQEQMRQAFVNNKDKQKEECQKRSQELKLETFEGRDRVNKNFVQEVEMAAKFSSPSEKTKKKIPSKSKQDEMGDIDDDDDNKANKPEDSKADIPSSQQQQKPKNEIMECNSNDFVIALRMGLPDIAINVIQTQIQDFFKESALNMHFEGETKTPSQLKLEFLQNPMDDGGNTILHYACYYESYQTIKVICNAALEAATKHHDYGAFESVLTQNNYHNQTPYYFVNIAQDQSISTLMESQIEISKIIKQRTMLFPALAAGGKRILGIFQHIGIVTTLTTVLAFITANIGFDLSKTTSLLSLVVMQVVGKDLPGVRRISAFLSFCGLRKLATFIYVEFLKDFIMVELVLVLAPIVLAGLVSSRRKHWLLLPFHAHQQLSIWLSRILNFITPKATAKRGMTQLFFLTIIMLMLFGLKKVI